MFASYFDEAGGDDLGFTVIGGFGATIAQWESFECDWKLFLSKFNVPYLHMKDFTQSKKCFAKWEGKEIVRAEFMGMAAEIIAAHTRRAFISIVPHEIFNEVDKFYTLKERFKTPYALAGRSCIGLANQWARNARTKALEIEYIFEDGGPDKGGLVAAVTASPPFLPAPSFKPGRDETPTKNWPHGRVGLVQLQAADYLAYEIRKVVFNAKKGIRIPRKSLDSLTKVPLDKLTFSTKRLLTFC